VGVDKEPQLAGAAPRPLAANRVRRGHGAKILPQNTPDASTGNNAILSAECINSWEKSQRLSRTSAATAASLAGMLRDFASRGTPA